jgi:hypothetical protein
MLWALSRDPEELRRHWQQSGREKKFEFELYQEGKIIPIQLTLEQ